jgi:predicted anti-sigma-YlaC factor YlaD
MSMTHELATELLAPYVDGALPLGEAAAVRAHLAECAACSGDVAGLERLNQALAFAPAPPVAFAAFWAGIQKQLPKPRAQARVRVVRRSLVLAFGLAALLVVTTAASAFASDRVLPDSPIYSLKRVGETVRLDLTRTRKDRVRLELSLAIERLHEAQAMATARKNQLALASLQNFQALLKDAGPELENSASADRPDMLRTISTLSDGLTQVEAAATTQADETDVQVETVVQDAQAELAQDERDAGSPSAGNQPGPTPEPQQSNLPVPSSE